MGVLEWRSEFGVGIDTVDHDHRQLISRIRECQRRLAGCEDPDRVLEILGEIYADIAAHFELEEEEMRRTHYPALADHKEDHDTLLDELREMMGAVEDDGVLDDAQLTDDLDRWFSDHFRTHDARLHRGSGPDQR